MEVLVWFGPYLAELKGLLLALLKASFLVGFGRSFGVLGIESRSAVYKASTLYPVLSFWLLCLVPPTFLPLLLFSLSPAFCLTHHYHLCLPRYFIIRAQCPELPAWVIGRELDSVP